MMRVMHFIPTFVMALAILAVGYILAKTVTKFLVSFCRTIGIDKVCTKVGITHVLKNGKINQKPSSLIGCMFYWTVMIGVLITTVKIVGLTMATELLDKVLAYIPSIFSGVFVLIIGMLLAKFVSVLVYVTAKNTDMPIPETLAKLSKLAIVVYVSIIYLKEIGFVALFSGATYSVFMTGIVFALALAFGLAGKDVAAKYLTLLKREE
jgi:hypothetical protein